MTTMRQRLAIAVSRSGHRSSEGPCSGRWTKRRCEWRRGQGVSAQNMRRAGSWGSPPEINRTTATVVFIGASVFDGCAHLQLPKQHNKQKQGVANVPTGDLEKWRCRKNIPAVGN